MSLKVHSTWPQMNTKALLLRLEEHRKALMWRRPSHERPINDGGEHLSSTRNTTV